MRVKYTGLTDQATFTNGKVYEVLAIEGDGTLYRIIDETGEDYLYPLGPFVIVDDSPPSGIIPKMYYEE